MRRNRYKRYTYGDQWCDPVRGRRGNYVSEEDALIESGKRPMINNLIRQLVKTVVGRYRTRAIEDGTYKGEIAVRNCLAEPRQPFARGIPHFGYGGAAYRAREALRSRRRMGRQCGYAPVFVNRFATLAAGI